MKVMHVFEFCYNMVITGSCLVSTYISFTRNKQDIFKSKRMSIILYKYINSWRNGQIYDYIGIFFIFTEIFTNSNFFKRLMCTNSEKSSGITPDFFYSRANVHFYYLDYEAGWKLWLTNHCCNYCTSWRDIFCLIILLDMREKILNSAAFFVDFKSESNASLWVFNSDLGLEGSALFAFR